MWGREGGRVLLCRDCSLEHQLRLIVGIWPPQDREITSRCSCKLDGEKLRTCSPHEGLPLFKGLLLCRGSDYLAKEHRVREGALQEGGRGSSLEEQHS